MLPASSFRNAPRRERSSERRVQRMKINYILSPCECVCVYLPSTRTHTANKLSHSTQRSTATQTSRMCFPSSFRTLIVRRVHRPHFCPERARAAHAKSSYNSQIDRILCVVAGVALVQNGGKFDYRRMCVCVLLLHTAANTFGPSSECVCGVHSERTRCTHLSLDRPALDDEHTHGSPPLLCDHHPASNSLKCWSACVPEGELLTPCYLCGVCGVRAVLCFKDCHL